MNLFLTALPLLLLAAFLTVVYWPAEARAVYRRLRTAYPQLVPIPHVRLWLKSSLARPHGPRNDPPLPLVRPVRRRARRSFRSVPRPRAERCRETTLGIEQARTSRTAAIERSIEQAIERERIRFARELQALDLPESTIVEKAWGVRRGGGKAFMSARETFRREVLDVTEAEGVAA